MRFDLIRINGGSKPPPYRLAPNSVEPDIIRPRQ